MAENALIEITRKNYQTAQEYMKLAKVSTKGWSASNHVFGYQSDERKSDVAYAKYLEFPERKEFPQLLKCMYDILGATDREFYFGAWGFESIDAIGKTREQLEQFGQHALLRVATKYEGMGWQIAIFLDRNTGKFFLLSVGGSNGYDRQASSKGFLDYVEAKSDHKTYTLTELMTNILENEDFGPSKRVPDEAYTQVIAEITAKTDHDDNSSDKDMHPLPVD